MAHCIPVPPRRNSADAGVMRRAYQISPEGMEAVQPEEQDQRVSSLIGAGVLDGATGRDFTTF